MEGVGGRLGRSSSRYGTTTVFTGPVRKWSKSWVPISPSPSSSSSSSSSSSLSNAPSIVNNSSSSSSSSSSSVSHLRLYKWTPLSKSSSSSSSSPPAIPPPDWNNNSPNHTTTTTTNTTTTAPPPPPPPIHKKIHPRDNPSKDDHLHDAAPLQPPRRKFKFVPIAVLEEHKKEKERNSDDESKPIDLDEDIANGNKKKPDINDVPMEENEDFEENQTAPARQDLNELDLSLGLTSHEEEHDSDS